MVLTFSLEKILDYVNSPPLSVSMFFFLRGDFSPDLMQPFSRDFFPQGNFFMLQYFGIFFFRLNFH